MNEETASTAPTADRTAEDVMALWADGQAETVIRLLVDFCVANQAAVLGLTGLVTKQGQAIRELTAGMKTMSDALVRQQALQDRLLTPIMQLIGQSDPKPEEPKNG